MKADENPPRRVSGNAAALPDQGAAETDPLCEIGEVRQSCVQTPDGGGPLPIRLRLARSHAERWQALPAQVRTHAATVVFGTWCEGIDLADLMAMASEFRLARLALSQALMMAREGALAIDEKPVQRALSKINKVLGGKSA